MKTLIIASGHTGTTVKAANLLKNKLGEAIVWDTNEKMMVDLTEFDILVFGTNIRMGMFNKTFKKCTKKYRKIISNKIVFGYCVGMNSQKSEMYSLKLQKKLPNSRKNYFITGELNPEKAAGMSKNIINSILLNLQKEGKEAPKVDQEKIQLLAEDILCIMQK